MSAAWLSGCARERQGAIGQAFVGPKKLTIRKDVDPKSDIVATLAHGERLDILGRRRRFVKVRTGNDAVGWTHMGQLMAADDMTALDDLAEQAKTLPSQGAATVYEPLNVHSAPNRQAPGFYQIAKGEEVQVLLNQTAPRVPFKPAPLFAPVQRRPAPKRGRNAKYPPPPMPPAPKPPENWLELSKAGLPEEMRVPPKPVPIDDWSLVKLRTGRAGWVLTTQLRMNIPDEVAQYSEGQRITSYFPMMEVRDGDKTRHHWLWTTLSTPKQDYQFDGFRYFIWNVKHHRYETAYIERKVKGYFPVVARQVQAVGQKQQTETFPGFTLILEEPDGAKYKKTYAFQYYRVVLVDKQPYQPPPESVEEEARAAEAAADTPEPGRIESWLGRIKRIRRRLFGG